VANIAKINRLDKPASYSHCYVSTANSSTYYLYYCFQLSNLVCVKRKICFMRGMHIIMRMQVATIVLQFYLIAAKSHFRIYYIFAQHIFMS